MTSFLKSIYRGNIIYAICLIVLQGLAVLVGERLGVTLDQFGRNHPGGAIGEYLRNGEVR